MFIKMKKISGKKYSSGFSLIELLVVLAIIGILTAVVATSTTASHESARDERRVADLKEIQIDLAQYESYYGFYPSSLSAMSNFVVGGLGSIPLDPLNSQSYFYAPIGTSPNYTSYCVGATLEIQTPDANDLSTCIASPDNVVLPQGSKVNYMQLPPQ